MITIAGMGFLVCGPAPVVSVSISSNLGNNASFTSSRSAEDMSIRDSEPLQSERTVICMPDCGRKTDPGGISWRGLSVGSRKSRRRLLFPLLEWGG